MANEILAFLRPAPGSIIILLIMFGVVVVLPIWFIRYLVKNKRENQRLRLEVGKLADGLERLRKQNQND